MRPRLTVVVPLRNRSGPRLGNCLRSTRWQDLPDSEIQLVLSDFGSDAAHRQSVNELAFEHRAEVVHTETRGVWNRSRALNIGIRASRGVYVLCTDADMIFAPNFFSTLLDELDGVADRKMVVCRCYDLPAGLEQRSWERHQLPDLVRQATLREKLGTGACQATRRDWFIGVRGYDEGYLYWGLEDNDMLWRARRGGLRIVWIHDRTFMLHQWHPGQKNVPLLLRYRNELRYRLTRRIMTKNRRSWGGRED